MKTTLSENSIRLSMFLKVAQATRNLKFRMPHFYVLDHTEIPTGIDNNTVEEWANAIKEQVLAGTEHFPNEYVFAHPCPIDEYYYQHLSFAGVYESYKPLRDKNKKSNIVDGIIKVIQGRYNEYSNYYYSRHKINGSRKVGIIFTPLVDNCCMFGTAYVYEDKCLFDYYDTPLSIYMNDPKRVAASRGSSLEGYEKKLAESAFDIQSIFGRPLDIEFIITRNEEVFINQIRPISKPHLHNWAMLEEVVWQTAKNSPPPSNVLNTIGSVKGFAIDLRARKPNEMDFYDPVEKIYIVNHGQNLHGTSSLEFLKLINEYNVANINIILDHGKTRKNNHLQYIVFEDPGISFVANMTNLSNDTVSKQISLVSDGFNVVMREI